MVREINQAGLDLIKRFEGIADGDPSTVNLDPYLDPIGIWTIGWGHALRDDKGFIKGKSRQKAARQVYPGGLTISQAEDLLRTDLVYTCREVQEVLRVPVTDNQFAALVSFAFNCGIGNFRGSTLLKMVNEGNFVGASEQFKRWNKARGKVLPGLTNRRQAEAELFCS